MKTKDHSTSAASGSNDTTVAPPNGSLIKLPPPTANIPAPPQGFVPTHGSDYRGLLPKKTELAVLPDAIDELNQFTDFAQVFGKTIPTLVVVLATLEAAQQWSSMRAKTSEWDLFCRTQEGLAWKNARALFSTLRPAFNLASGVDSAVSTQNPSLTRLLAAATTIAQRGAATRKAKRKLAAEGKAPVGKAKGATAPGPDATTGTGTVNGAAAPAGAVNGAGSGPGH
jgi:hypothetical protein